LIAPEEGRSGPAEIVNEETVVNTSTVYYCWVCETQLPGDALSDTHYESEREIFFCSPWHLSEYQALKGL
jgi:hypothetical protein